MAKPSEVINERTVWVYRRMKHFIDWLYATPLSHVFQTVGWIIPVTQSIHLVCLSVLFTSMMMLDLHLIGVTGRHSSVETYVNRFLPWLWGALPILLTTGLIMIIAEPNRDLQNIAFYTKMSLLIAVCALTYGLQRGVRNNPAAWERAGARRRLGRVLGSASLVFWVGIVVAGRLIAYV